MIYAQEEPRHAPFVKSLHDQVFSDPDRHKRMSAQLRQASDPVAALNILAINPRISSDELAGSVRGYAVQAGGRSAALVSPLAINKDNQGNGLGKTLMDRFCHHAAKLGFEMVVLKASTPAAKKFYSKLGFTSMEGTNIQWPSAEEAPDAMVIALQPGAIQMANGPVTAWKANQQPAPQAAPARTMKPVSKPPHIALPRRAPQRLAVA